MASLNQLATNAGTTDTLAFTSIDPGGSGIVIVVASRMANGGDDATPTITDSVDGSTGWSVVATSRDPAASFNYALRVWRKDAWSGARTITLDGTSTIFSMQGSVFQTAAVDVVAPVNGTWSVTASIGDGAESGTLSAAPNANDLTVAVVCVDASAQPAVTWGGGYSSFHTRAAGASGGGPFEIGTRTGSTSTSVDITDSYTGGGSFFHAIALAFTLVDSGVSVPVAAYLTPTLVADRGTLANLTSQTAPAVDLAAGASIAVGNYLVARLALNNSGTNGAASALNSITDPAGNTWTFDAVANVDPGAANAGATARIAYCRVDTAYANGDDITFNFGTAITAKSIVIEEWTNINKTTPIAVDYTTTTETAGTTPGPITRTPTRAGQLVYGMLAVEGPTGDTFTQDTDTTDGSWVTLTRLSTANATATNNQTNNGVYKVVTGITIQSWAPTFGTARDAAMILMVFDAEPAKLMPNLSTSRRRTRQRLAERALR